MYFLRQPNFIKVSIAFFLMGAFFYLPAMSFAQYYDDSYWDDYQADNIYDNEPSVYSVSPSNAQVGEEVRISGSFGLNQGRVKIDGENAKITEWFSSAIYVIVPDDADEGRTKVQVFNKRGDSDSVEIYVLAGPEITSVYPTDVVPGISQIQIVGKNFGNSSVWQYGADTEIFIRDQKITNASWSDTLISFYIPDNIDKSGNIEITIKGIDLPPVRYTVKKEESSSSRSSADKAVLAEEPNDEFFDKQYYVQQMKVRGGWAYQDNARGVTVAVIDDGVYINHPDLKSSIWKNTKEIVGNGLDDDNNGYVDDVFGWDFVSEEAEMSTRGTHGTAVAGIIAATKNNRIGISGLAPGVKIMPLIACDERIGCPVDDVVEAINYAVKNGADVINLSLGSQGTTRYTNQYDAAINNARNMGVVVVASAGNGDIEGGNGQNLAQIPVSPVCNGSQNFTVIGVAGLNEQNDWLDWSNYGDCVDVAAPAMSIITTLNPFFEDDYEYGYMDGTSFSAPMVSALAALMIAQDPGLSVGDLVRRMRTAAHNRSDYNNLLGSGWVDFEAALQAGAEAKSASGKSTSDEDREVMLKQIQELLVLIAVLQAQLDAQQ